jgi:ABC-2 type transport system ATP-binding protein
VDGLCIRYGNVTAVQGLSLAALAGQVTCVVGRNGAGKTSTIEALEGIRRPSSGRLSVLGLDPRRDRRRLVPRIGVMLQDGGIQPAIRVGEALQHAAALYPASRPVPELTDKIGLAGMERRTHRSLSGGERKRLALGLALIGRPEVAFLDEPTAGVDPEGRVAIRELIGDLRDDGVTVVLSSHELDEVERLADRVVMIDGGCLVAEGSVDELVSGRHNGGGVVTFRAESGIDVAGLAAHLGAQVLEPSRGEYRVEHPPSSDPPSNADKVVAVTRWLAEQGVMLRDLRVGRRSLEEVFLAKVAELDQRSEPVANVGEARAKTAEPGSEEVAP